MSDPKHHPPTIKVGDTKRYLVQDGDCEILAVHETTAEGYQIVDIKLTRRVYNPETDDVYGSPQGPPQ